MISLFHRVTLYQTHPAYTTLYLASISYTRKCTIQNYFVYVAFMEEREALLYISYLADYTTNIFYFILLTLTAEVIKHVPYVAC